MPETIVHTEEDYKKLELLYKELLREHQRLLLQDQSLQRTLLNLEPKHS